jgi:hypothetical protein
MSNISAVILDHFCYVINVNCVIKCEKFQLLHLVIYIILLPSTNISMDTQMEN